MIGFFVSFCMSILFSSIYIGASISFSIGILLLTISNKFVAKDIAAGTICGAFILYFTM
jgi:hypothetical protein